MHQRVRQAHQELHQVDRQLQLQEDHQEQHQVDQQQDLQEVQEVSQRKDLEVAVVELEITIPIRDIVINQKLVETCVNISGIGMLNASSTQHLQAFC